jgi:hypothetical protein
MCNGKNPNWKFTQKNINFNNFLMICIHCSSWIYIDSCFIIIFCIQIVIERDLFQTILVLENSKIKFKIIVIIRNMNGMLIREHPWKPQNFKSPHFPPKKFPNYPNCIFHNFFPTMKNYAKINLKIKNMEKWNLILLENLNTKYFCNDFFTIGCVYQLWSMRFSDRLWFNLFL